MSDISEPNNELIDTGIDIAGVGKAMRAIPPSAWKQMVETACVTFEKTLSPITEASHGIGRLIKSKFDRLIDAEQVMTAESVASAKRKAEDSGQSVRVPRPQILLQIIENAAGEVDSGVRELWSNLLAQEMVTQAVHPEIGRVLARISFEDAQLLVAITETKPSSLTLKFAQAVKGAFEVSGIGFSFPLRSDPLTFNHAHLRNLGLIEMYDGKWDLTVFGEGFIEAVTDPSIELQKNT